ncbi:DNA mismatch repair protein MutL [Glonium stellatum]|uniref:DNA mismatch repair protein PMS1 n=1 Tax=Glonium stellatum TaxID=574774 RepID=A0A8E2F830_9PEZI|nr:DNA mismatch repair protein MutL [Glonium stellatum]
MATIKPIEARSVHQIQSGQVIIDICSVVKELVENSLDAGAKSIDVRFKNHGLDSIEVHDNGGGIAPEDYETIALKHYTSKLSAYDDLNCLRTFGFRGEALSSLCALSKFHIITARTVDGAKGTKLDFETSGKLKSTSIVACQKGTIVVVENLFHNLPVRRRELEKNIKREYGKVLSVLHAYACISTEVRFAASNQMPKGKKAIVFSTNSNLTTKENIANVYGAKTLFALIPLNLQFEMDSGTGLVRTTRKSSTQEDSTSRKVKILGHISRPVVGEGRQTPDRQMFFVNSRPCSLPQVAKAFNEAYKSYNITQSPFIFADLKLDTNAYDVNVSPDKRTILLHDQTTLLETLKASLLELFASHDQSVPQSQLSVRKSLANRPPMATRNGADQPSGEEKTIVGKIGVEGENFASSDQLSSSSSSEDVACLVGPTVSLIQDFVGRNTEDRIGHSSEQNSIPFPKKNQQLSSFPSLGGKLPPHGQDTADMSVMSLSPDTSKPEKKDISEIVQDCSLQASSLHTGHMEQKDLPNPPGLAFENDIPSVKHSPQKSAQSSIQNAFDRMRPRRVPVETATITIGNTTTRSTVGSTPRKRRRIHTPKFGSNVISSPLSARSLRTFAAQVMQGESEDGGDTSEDERRRQDSDISVSIPQSNASSNRNESKSSPDADGQNKVADKPTLILTTGDDEVDESDDEDSEYVNEAEKRSLEESKVAHMIASAEELAAKQSHDNLKRAASLLKGPGKKYSTLYLAQSLNTSIPSIYQSLSRLGQYIKDGTSDVGNDPKTIALPDSTPEERLSLTVSKSDFGLMRIIGQFNLGFILAVRPSSNSKSCRTSLDLFIIDQHASDEKYNFERLTASTILTAQRLVHPHALILTAIEEEIILSHSADLTANGFVVDVDTSGATPVGQRCKLLSLPMSREVTFTPSDLEELLALISDHAGQDVPRPSKVRRLLASRACRGSVMVGKSLTAAQMEKVVRHMGSMEKPWSCPHGRPTMRHLLGLSDWDSWEEGDGLIGMAEEKKVMDWGLWLTGRVKEK